MRRRKYLHPVLLIFTSLLILMLLASPAHGFQVWGYHWRPSHVGLKYDWLSPAWRDVVYNSRMTWNNVGAGMYITYDPNSPDSVRVDPYGDTGWLGLTSQTVLPDGAWFQVLTIFVNTYYPIVPYTPSSSQYDGQSVVTHELGHFDGLWDHNYPPATMYYGMGPGETDKRDLDPDDSGGLIVLYPLIYRLYNGANHFYTQDVAEKDRLISWGWSYEGVRFYAHGGVVGGNVPLYRLYNGSDHFYTISAAERDMLISWGWSYEGIATYVLDYAADDTRPLYRLYNGRDHFYTIDPSERDYAISVGYALEGTAAYVRYR